MQEKRKPKLSSKKNYINIFKELIKSLIENGFNNDYPIEYSHNYLLRNGSHRLSYCYYLQKTFICIKINPRATTGPYSIDWFKQEGFSEKELNIIKNEQNKLTLFISS